MTYNLADRLLEAADSALYKETRNPIDISRTAVVAVLRVLDQFYFDHESDAAQLDVGSVADEIEAGA